MSEQTNENTKELTLERVFNASPEQIFKMWTDPEHLAKWYGPKGITVADCKLDVRPGGKITIDMKMPNGAIYPSPGIFREIVENEKLVFSLLSHYDENGEPQIEMLQTVTLEEQDGKTKMIFNVVEVKTIEGVVPLKGLDRAWGQSFDKLEEALAE
ncbi:MAG: SRPBCC family protein [Candidatus Hodarchaeales archaeon]|jgi:uncharacterized protein YndB with AHSA1/START domain